MARRYAPLLTSTWQNKDFMALSSAAQRLYLVALSQQNISWCGVVSFTARRWATYSTSESARSVTKAATELVDADLIVLDEDTEELWVRSFMKHNVVGQPKLTQAATREFAEVHSDRIREAIATAYPWVSDTPGDPLATGTSENDESGVLGVGDRGQGSSAEEQPTSSHLTPTPTTEVLAEYEAEAERQADAWLAKDPKSIIDRAGWIAKRIRSLTKQHDGGPLPKTQAKHLRLVCPNPDCRQGYDLSGEEPVPCETCRVRKAS